MESGLALVILGGYPPLQLPMDQQPFTPPTQNPFLSVETANQFAENPENRCACVLLLDVSHSMSGEPLRELQDGLTAYRDSLAADSLARKRVEVAIVTFGGTVDVVQAFTTADMFTAPNLVPKGDTPMAQAVITALDLVQQRKNEYQTHGVGYYRPWVFLITDGGPTDANSPQWPEAISRIAEGEGKKRFSFFAVGVEGADFERLGQLSKREPLKLKGLAFRKLFEWLSSSQQAVSRSQPADEVALSNPTGPQGWASI